MAITPAAILIFFPDKLNDTSARVEKFRHLFSEWGGVDIEIPDGGFEISKSDSPYSLSVLDQPRSLPMLQLWLFISSSSAALENTLDSHHVAFLKRCTKEGIVDVVDLCRVQDTRQEKRLFRRRIGRSYCGNRRLVVPYILSSLLIDRTSEMLPSIIEFVGPPIREDQLIDQVDVDHANVPTFLEIESRSDQFQCISSWMQIAAKRA